MGSNSSVPITAGTGTPIDTYLLAGGDYQQIVREARAATAPLTTWSPVATGTGSVLAADQDRVSLLIVNDSSTRVLLRFDTTIPTMSVFGWYLDSGDRWEVPKELCQLALSVIPDTTPGSGNVLITAGTAA